MKYTLLFVLFFAFLMLSCSQKAKMLVDAKKNDDWKRNATIYEVNLRQHTEEGTFEAFQKRLHSIKDLGIDIVWFMPIFPIGEKNRKGNLGSYYSVQNYKKTNPEFGTLEDFRGLVDSIHELGMYVIIDWVPNHTAWDNTWTVEHPDWYVKKDGNFIPPIGTDWSDVIQLDYENQEMRTAMREAMLFWVKEYDIDGFRCDVAGKVPTDFWNNTRKALDSVKSIFMLAEAEKPELNHFAFHASYGWELMHINNDIAAGKKDASHIDAYLNGNYKKFAQTNLMWFTSNHDENTWSGTVFERLGEGAETFAVLTYMLPGGMPLIYNGQEAELDKRLAFFEKDTIEWKDTRMYGVYKSLNLLRKTNKALWGNPNTAVLKRITSNNDKAIFASYRQEGAQIVVSIFNLSDTEQKTIFSYPKEIEDATYQLFNLEDDLGHIEQVYLPKELELAPWEYKVFYKN